FAALNRAVVTSHRSQSPHAVAVTSEIDEVDTVFAIDHPIDRVLPDTARQCHRLKIREGRCNLRHGWKQNIEHWTIPLLRGGVQILHCACLVAGCKCGLHSIPNGPKRLIERGLIGQDDWNTLCIDRARSIGYTHESIDLARARV